MEPAMRANALGQAGVGVLVCEALRERSEQRANKYPAAACTTEQRAVALQAALLLIRNPLRDRLPLTVLDLVEVQVVATLVFLRAE